MKKQDNFMEIVQKNTYTEAINSFEKNNKFTYVFFHSDIEWVKENFKDLK
jgi:hypothetical protein